MNKETSDFCGTRGEAEGRQAELDRKFKGKKFEIYKENCIWKCRLPKKLKNKKQKQLF